MSQKSFGSQKEEADYWKKLLKGVVFPDEEWEALSYEPRATVRARSHVYRVRLDDGEMAALQAIAKIERVPASAVLRRLIRSEARRKSSGTRKSRAA